MPVLQPDTTEAEDFSTPINPGTYKARIDSCDGGVSKNGNQKIMPIFKVKVGDQTRTRKAHIVITGAGAMSFDQLLRACHMDKLADHYRDKSVKEKKPFDTNTLVGQELQIIIDKDLYKPEDGGQERVTDKIIGYLKV